MNPSYPIKAAEQWNEEFPQFIVNPTMDPRVKEECVERYLAHLREVQLNAAKAMGKKIADYIRRQGASSIRKPMKWYADDILALTENITIDQLSK